MNFNFARQINWSSLAFKANLIKWSTPTLSNYRKWSLLGFQTLQSEDNCHHQSLLDLVSANLRKNGHHGSYLWKTMKMVITSLIANLRIWSSPVLANLRNWSLPGLFSKQSSLALTNGHQQSQQTSENGHHQLLRSVGSGHLWTLRSEEGAKDHFQRNVVSAHHFWRSEVNGRLPCQIISVRSLMGSTDQADLSCFYFRISQILMERC